MIRNSVIVFDDFISTAAAFTSDAFSTALATYDRVAFHVVVDTTTGAGNGTLTIKGQHCGPGVGMTFSSNEAEWIDAVTVLNAVTVHLDTREQFYGNLGSLPLLSYVRLKMTLGGSMTAGHVRIYATMRDPSG